MRQVSTDLVEVGAGTLISPGLVLTALHVVCDTGQGLKVPEDRDRPAIRVRLKSYGALQPDGRRANDDIFEARLIWPAAGAPAQTGGWDVALLALDNRELTDGLDEISAASYERFSATVQRLQLHEDFGRLILDWEGEPWLFQETEWRFGGYPSVARQINKQALQALGKSEKLDLPIFRTAQVTTLTPDPETGYFEGISASILLRNAASKDSKPDEGNLNSDEKNPLRGTSGASVYGFHTRQNVNRVYIAGVVSRARPQAGGNDLFSFTPLPARRGRAGAGPDKASGDEFWRLVDEDKFILRSPFQLALDTLHFLDRRLEVKHFLTGYSALTLANSTRGYFFGFACTTEDLQEMFFQRLQAESLTPSDRAATALFDLKEMTNQRHTYLLRGRDDDAWIATLEKMAQHVGADPRAGDEALNSIIQRLALCRAPRILRFVVNPDDIFDKTLAATAWARTTLNQLLQSVSRWAGMPVFPPLGRSSFKYSNPIVVLLAVVTNYRGAAQITPQDFARVDELVEPSRRLFERDLDVPSNIHCAFFRRALDAIQYDDFLEWYAAQVDPRDDDGNAHRIARRIQSFRAVGDACRKAAILKAIEDLNSSSFAG